MKMGKSNMKRTLAKVAAALQIGIGVLLLIGTICLMLTAYQTVKDKSRQITKNLSAAGDALESWRTTYAQSATNLFGLIGTVNDISTKLSDVSAKVSRTGELFAKVPFAKGAGEKWTDVGFDIASIAKALKRQGEIIEGYHDNRHEKVLIALSETITSLRLTTQMLDDDSSAGKWCGFVCVLGFFVSLLFITNGLLLCVFAQSENGFARANNTGREHPGNDFRPQT